MTSNRLHMFIFDVSLYFGNDVPILWERVVYVYVVHSGHMFYSLELLVFESVGLVVYVFDEGDMVGVLLIIKLVEGMYVMEFTFI